MMRRITQHKRIWIGTERNGYRGLNRIITGRRKRPSVNLDGSFWIPLIGAALFLMPLLGSAVASSFPVLEPRPLTVIDALGAVTPVPFHLAAIPLNTNDVTRAAEPASVAGLSGAPGASEASGRISRSDIERALAAMPSTGLPGRSSVNAASYSSRPGYTVISPGDSMPGWRSNVLRNAYSRLGTAYVWGGDKPGGFDCSGFVQYVMEHSGINLPRTAREQKNRVQSIAKNDLKPGDLVFFRHPDHVGIYAGNGNFIHAGNERSGVTISSLNQELYLRRYDGGGRVAE